MGFLRAFETAFPLKIVPCVVRREAAKMSPISFAP
jgi:hypothetical protein